MKAIEKPNPNKNRSSEIESVLKDYGLITNDQIKAKQIERAQRKEAKK